MRCEYRCRAPFKLSMSADKGMSFSAIDEVFVNLKKNHFQVS